MSSTEQAPEPTMDEILASIRRIIADDEASAGSRPAPNPVAAQRREPEPPREDAAVRSRLVEDIAHALRGSDDEPPVVSTPEEDILDLTNDMFAAEEAAATPEPQHAERRRVDALWDDSPLPRPVPAQADELAEPEPRAMAIARIAEAVAAKGASARGGAERPFMGAYAEETFAASEEPFGADDVGEAEPPAPESYAPPPEKYESFGRAAESFAPQGGSVRWEEEPRNGSVAVSGTQSLEDCVREMLRPMLRDWLDTNLPRILESAVRDELAEQVRDKRRQH